VLLVVRLLYIVDIEQAPVSGWEFIPGGLLINVLVFVRLATTDRLRDQWVGWCINWAVLLIMLFMIVPNLTPPTV
jgi:hypothetical protein